MKKLQDYEVQELESLAWKTLVAIEQGQNQLKVINQELARRQQVQSAMPEVAIPDLPTETRGVKRAKK